MHARTHALHAGTQETKKQTDHHINDRLKQHKKMFNVIFAIIVILLVAGAARYISMKRRVARLLASRAKKEGERRPTVAYDPLGLSFHMARSPFGSQKYDTVICGCLQFDKLPQLQDFVNLFREKEIDKHAALHCVANVDDYPMVLIPAVDVDPSWTLEKHFVEREIAGGQEGTMKILEDIINDSKLLAREQQTMPLWRMYLLREKSSGGGGALCVQISHGIADGLSILRVFSALLSGGSPLPTFAPKGSRGPTGVLQLLLHGLDFVLCMLTLCWEFLGAADSGTPLNPGGATAQLETKKRIVLLPEHSLETIKAIKNAAGAGTTVNDVEFALMGGMLRRYHERCGLDQNSDSGRSYRCITPVAFPFPIKEEDTFTKSMTNGFCFVQNILPTAHTQAAARLKASSTSWARLKASSHVPASFFVTSLIGIACTLNLQVLQRWVTTQLFSRMSFLFSNLPGPQPGEDGKLYVAGSKVTKAFALHACPVPMVITVSLGGVMHSALVASEHAGGPDPASCPLEEIPQLFNEELAAMCEELEIKRVV